MKKIVITVALLCVAILFVACNRQEEPAPLPHSTPTSTGHAPALTIDTATGTPAGEYIYQAVEILAADNSQAATIVRYHLQTGKASYLCQDPYCDHKTDSCPFFMREVGGNGVAFIGDTVFFVRQSEQGIHSICAYDAKSTKITTLYEDEFIVADLKVYQYSLYYSLVREDHYAVYRYDVGKDESEWVFGVIGGEIQKIENDWIYTRNLYGKTAIYDLNGKKVSSVRQNDYRGYVYRLKDWTMTHGWRDFVAAYERTPAGSEEWQTVLERISVPLMVNESIVYYLPIPLDEQKKYNWDEENPTYDIYGGRVYIAKLDGSENRLLCHAEDCIIIQDGSELYSGDWMGIRIAKCVVDANGNRTDRRSDLLLVNLKTGEYHVSRFDTGEEVIGW